MSAARGCANCLRPIGHTQRTRGPDRAWMGCCRDCTELVADQMQVVYDRPHGCPIQLLRCTWCGIERSCRPGWYTRCHVCFDERTNGECISTDIVEVLADPGTSKAVRDFADLNH